MTITTTVTTTGVGSTIRVDQIPSTLTTFTIIATASGNDTLIGLDQTNAWSITGADSGSLAGTPTLNFSGVENLTGRTGADTFTFSNGGSLSGLIDGGIGAVDVVDYSASTTGVTVDLRTGPYRNIETLKGSLGIDTLVGPNMDNLWHVIGPGSGTIGGLAFSGIENLTGGSGADDFQLSAAAVISRIDGGAGRNTLELTTTDAPDIVVAGAPTLAWNGTTTAYANVLTLDINTFGASDRITVNPAAVGFPENVNINSGLGNDQITVNLLAGVATTINVDGGAPIANDTLLVKGTAGPDVIAVDGLEVTFDKTQVVMTAIKNLTVDGGGGNDQLNLTGTTVSGTVSLLGEGDHNTITLNNPTVPGSLVVDGGTGAANALVVNLSDAADTVTLGAETLTVTAKFTARYHHFASLDLETMGGEDHVTVTNTHAGTTAVSTGDGIDTVTIQNTAGPLNVATGDGTDTINVQAIGASATIDAGAGEDTVNIGSKYRCISFQVLVGRNAIPSRTVWQTVLHGNL